VQARYLGKKQGHRTDEGLGRLAQRPPAVANQPTERGRHRTGCAGATERSGGRWPGCRPGTQAGRDLPGRGRRAEPASAHAGSAGNRADLPRHGLRGAHRSWIETEWNNFDALNTPADHPAATCKTPSMSRVASSCARTPRRYRFAPCWPPAAGEDHRARQCVSSRRRRHPHAHVPAVRGLHVDRNVSFEDSRPPSSRSCSGSSA